MERMAGIGSGRTLLGLCIAMGGSLTIAASFTFMLTPMLADLGLTSDEASSALSLPSVAALLVVFVAGRLGERRGHRTVVSWMSVLFVVGSVLVATTQGIALLSIGLLLSGIAATSIQIVVVGLLSNSFPDGAGRARAFGTFGMVSPFVWLLFPVLTGVIVLDLSWRIVPAIWALGGVAMLVAARVLLPAPGRVEPLGDVRSPVLAGLVVVLAVEAVSIAGSEGVVALPFAVVALALVLAVIVLVALMRRTASPGFSLRTLRDGRARPLLGVVVVIPLINTVFFMTLAFQYLYDLTVLQTALIMVPAQAGAVLGTRYIAAPLMARIGVPRTAAWLFGVLAAAMLGSFLITPSSPLWVPALYVAVYNVLTVAASITVTSGLMSTAPSGDSGEVSAYRGSGVALGGVLAVVAMNAAVFGLSRLFLAGSFEDAGLTSAEAAALSAQIQSDATSTALTSQYAMPLPDGVPVIDVMRDAIATGLHINGVIGSLLALACIGLVLRAAGARQRDAAGLNPP